MKSKKTFSAKPLIYLITGGDITQQNFSEKFPEIFKIIKIAIENEISLIQVREKKLSARLIFELTAKVVQIAKNSETKILVNDRADIALAANADGVHLTSNSLEAQVIRRFFPPAFVIGVSAHTLSAAENAKRQGADFATFSPIFNSPGKGQPKGLSKLREVSEKLKGFPIVALGGIERTNYKSVLKTGAAGFAAIRFLNNAENLQNLKKELL